MGHRIVAILIVGLGLWPAWGVGSARAAPEWIVEPGSQLGFVAKQGGASVEGIFERFEAGIAFSAEDFPGSRVEVTIEIASVDSQSKDRDDAIKAPGLFDAAVWPTARFETTAFRRATDGHFEAQAWLTLRDVTREVVLPFSLEIGAHPEQEGQLQARAKGEITVNRLDYGVGQGIWQDTSMIADEVVIFLDLLARRPAD